MKNQRIRRKTGLQRPFNNYQIASWVILGFEFISTYFVFLPVLSGLEKVRKTFK
jgi:ABC-type spermidine/putrescine transport system permease subunit I